MCVFILNGFRLFFIQTGYLKTCHRLFFIFFITDTDYLYVHVPDNRYAEPIFIYCYKVNTERSPFFTFFFPSFSHLNNNKKLLKINIFM